VAAQIVATAGVAPGRREDSIQLGEDELLDEMTMITAAERFGLSQSHLPIDVRRRSAGEMEAAA
jgi:hypothetical protein